MALTVQQIVRLYLYFIFMLALKPVWSSYLYQRDVRSGLIGSEYEFGRIASQLLLEDDFEVDRNLKNGLEAELFYLSLSMSMDTSTGEREATIVPKTAFAPLSDSPWTLIPILEVAKRESVACLGEKSTPVSVTLQVELSVGKTDFVDDLEQALTNVITSAKFKYSSCDPQRRWMIDDFGKDETRNLHVADVSVLLSPIVVRETNERCAIQSISASTCRVAKAEMRAYGTDDSRMIVASVDSIVQNDASFDDELKMKGIIDVRVVQDTNNKTDVVASSTSNISSQAPPHSSQTVTAIVLSVGALTLVVAIILRRGANRRKQLRYAAPKEETDERHCLGIQPLDRMKYASDINTMIYYSPPPEHVSAATF